jgi:transcriptional regulator with XRE-family HTH domain
MLCKSNPELSWPVELVGEVVNESVQLLLSTTQSPEELVANSCLEQHFLLLCEGLQKDLQSATSTREQVWDQIGCILVTVGIEVRNALKNSISCNLAGEAGRLFPQFFLSEERNAMSLGKNIKLARISAGLKQKELADRLDVSTNYLSLIENDKREPSVSFLRALAKEINIPVGILFIDIENNLDKLSPEERMIFLKIKDLIWEIEQIRAAQDDIAIELA